MQCTCMFILLRQSKNVRTSQVLFNTLISLCKYTYTYQFTHWQNPVRRLHVRIRVAVVCTEKQSDASDWLENLVADVGRMTGWKMWYSRCQKQTGWADEKAVTNHAYGTIHITEWDVFVLHPVNWTTRRCWGGARNILRLAERRCLDPRRNIITLQAVCWRFVAFQIKTKRCRVTGIRHCNP